MEITDKKRTEENLSPNSRKRVLNVTSVWLTGREDVGDAQYLFTELFLPIKLRQRQWFGRVVQVDQRILQVQHQMMIRVQHLKRRVLSVSLVSFVILSIDVATVGA